MSSWSNVSLRCPHLLCQRPQLGDADQHNLSTGRVGQLTWEQWCKDVERVRRDDSDVIVPRTESLQDADSLDGAVSTTFPQVSSHSWIPRNAGTHTPASPDDKQPRLPHQLAIIVRLLIRNERRRQWQLFRTVQVRLEGQRTDRDAVDMPVCICECIVDENSSSQHYDAYSGTSHHKSTVLCRCKSNAKESRARFRWRRLDRRRGDRAGDFGGTT